MPWAAKHWAPASSHRGLPPAVGQRGLRGAQPRQVGPDRVVDELAVGRPGQVGGPLPVTSPARQDRVGVPEQAAVGPVDGHADLARLRDRRAARVSPAAASSSGHRPR